MDALFGIIGVLLGFALGAYWDDYRQRASRKRLRIQIREELKANKYMIPFKRATITSMLAAIAEDKVMAGDSVPFCDAIFSNHYPEIAPYLSQKERNILQVVYSTLSTIDRTMAEFEPAVRSAQPGDSHARVMVSFRCKLQDLTSALEIQERLITSFLEDSPIDVLQMDLPYEVVKGARIGRA